RRQELLNFPEPCRVESVRLTVRNTRGRIPVADEDQSTIEPSLQIRFDLVPIRDVQQLHDVGVVLPLTLQRTGDLFTDGGTVIGKRDEPRFVPCGLEPIAQQLSLCLLAALIQAFEGDEQSWHEKVYVQCKTKNARCKVLRSHQRSA